MKLGLVLLLGLLVAVGAGIAWFRAPSEAAAKGYVEVRLAQAEEVSPKVQAEDPTGAVWARHFEENLPARAARACGAERFDVVQGSDFHQAVQLPAADAGQPLLQCMRSKGGGYLRFAILDRQQR